MSKISGQVRTIDGAGIRLIRVAAYQGTDEIQYEFTDGSGQYELEVPSSTVVTLRFDTKPGMVNERDWHPSVVAHVSGDRDVVLDAFLTATATGAPAIQCIDIVAAYQFLKLWIGPGEEAKLAAARIGSFKLVAALAGTMGPMYDALRKHYDELSKSVL